MGEPAGAASESSRKNDQQPLTLDAPIQVTIPGGPAVDSAPPSGEPARLDVSDLKRSDLKCFSKLQNLVDKVFCFLTLKELFYFQVVNKAWRHDLKRTLESLTQLHFGQFWAVIGVSDKVTAPVQDIVVRATHLQCLNLGFCSYISPAFLLTLLNKIRERDKLNTLNLFYCIHITDQCIDEIVNKFRNLQCINIGRCPRLTPASIGHLKRLSDLKTLVLRSNVSLFTSGTVTALTSYPALKHLDVTHCALSKEAIETLQAKVDLIWEWRPRMSEAKEKRGGPS
jgi:hypothetical protein